jgi:hypothetical protein
MEAAVGFFSGVRTVVFVDHSISNRLLFVEHNHQNKE